MDISVVSCLAWHTWAWKKWFTILVLGVLKVEKIVLWPDLVWIAGDVRLTLRICRGEGVYLEKLGLRTEREHVSGRTGNVESWEQEGADRWPGRGCESLGTDGLSAVVSVLGSYVLWLAPRTPRAPSKCILNYGRQICFPQDSSLWGLLSSSTRHTYSSLLSPSGSTLNGVDNCHNLFRLWRTFSVPLPETSPTITCVWRKVCRLVQVIFNAWLHGLCFPVRLFIVNTWVVPA